MSEFLSTCLERLFGGDTPHYPLTALQVFARGAIVYIAGVGIVRLGKSRLISRATPLDVILGFILGSLLSRGITGHASISDTLVASAALVMIHSAFTAAACRFPRFEQLIKGHNFALVEHGRLRRENMLRAHVSIEDLEEAMRLQGIRNLSQVESAFKERNGEISMIGREQNPK